MARRRDLRGGRLTVVSLTLAMAACGSPAPDARGERHESAPARIRVIVPPWLTSAPLYITAARGFFAEQGLDVEFVSTQTTTAAIPLLLSGRVDVLPGPITPGFFHAIRRGARLRFVADKGFVDPDGCSFIALVARPAFVEQMTQVTRAAGRNGDAHSPTLGPAPAGPDAKPGMSVNGRRPRISLTPEPQFDYFVERALAPHGLSIADFERVRVPTAAEIHAFNSGTLEVAFMSDPAIVQALQETDIVLWKRVERIIPGYQFSLIAYGPRLLDEDPELGRRFMVAYLKGVRAYNEGKTEDNVQVLADALGFSTDLVRSSCWMPMRADGRIDLPSLESYQTWYVERGLLDAAATTDDLWDPSFIDYANRALTRSEEG